MPNTAVDYLHVVAAVIRHVNGNILLAQRPANKHQGGKWEFPGGKLEAGETPLQALHRELNEELGIETRQANPLIKVRYRYPERAVLLDVWEVSAFTGQPHGREGQPVAWFTPERLTSLEFPPANDPIITAARLPPQCLITPEPQDRADFLRQLEASLQAGIRLVQFRAKSLSADAYVALAQEVIDLVHAVGGKVMLNSPPVILDTADGLHLTGAQLHEEFARNMPRWAGGWLSASCHDAQALRQAADIGVDFVFLSPILPTLSHPGVDTLGWDAFKALVDQVNVPVYALGGMRVGDIPVARLHGGQGIAAIRGLWNGKQITH